MSLLFAFKSQSVCVNAEQQVGRTDFGMCLINGPERVGWFTDKGKFVVVTADIVVVVTVAVTAADVV